MDEQLIRQVDTLQRNFNNLSKPEITRDYISPYLGLPGLIGFWPMATVQRSTGNVPNYAPTFTGATKQDFVYNGNPTFNYTTTGVPYIDLDGTGDFLSVADNTDLDVQGNEAQNVHPGLTMGGWFYADQFTGQFDFLIGKSTFVDPLRSYWIDSGVTIGSGNLRFCVSSNGTSAGEKIAIATTAMSTAVWHFIAMRFTPSTEVAGWIDTDKYTNTSSVSATINNGAANFVIGADSVGGLLFDGKATLNFLCANAISDAIIQSLFQQTRSLFGV